MYSILDDVFDLIVGAISLIFTATVLFKIGYQLIDMNEFGFNTLQEPAILQTTVKQTTAPIATAQIITIPYVDSNCVDNTHIIAGVEYATDDIVKNRTSTMLELFNKFGKNTIETYNIDISYDKNTKTRTMKFREGDVSADK